MKTFKMLFAFFAVFVALMVSSCSIIGGIFKTGMGLGIAITVAIMVLIAILLLRIGKGRN